MEDEYTIKGQAICLAAFNPQLVVAAPDMYEALKKLTAFLAQHGSLDCENGECVCGYDMAEKALWKAEGIV